MTRSPTKKNAPKDFFYMMQSFKKRELLQRQLFIGTGEKQISYSI
jgi:hypothetical protein